ncbi:hypothetical protein [Brachyspira pilosicoli]|uniref:hypothetical protein n=1 Tax=Brachyspira pilosicoli TaxID=52584 RepID=UPI0030045783
MKKILLLLIISTLILSCSKTVDNDTIVYTKTSVSSVNIFIGDSITYEVHIISKKDIDYNYQDISFDDRVSQSRIISVENINKNKANFKERIIKYNIGFYDVGQFVISPFKISYNYNNEYRELYGEDINVLVNPFSDGDVLPPMKKAISIPMPLYVWIIIIALLIIIVLIIFSVLFLAKYIEKKFNERLTVKEDTEALNALKNIDYNIYYNENKFAEYYFELTFIFKRYLTKRFRFNIEDMTTSEISKLFKEINFIESDAIIKMFTEGDLIKFAKASADIELMEKDYNFCKNYILSNGNLYTALKKEEKEKKKLNKKLKKKRVKH